MYVKSEEIEKHALRQGDVISHVHILGAINLTGIHYTKNFEDQLTGWSVPAMPMFADAMVISHSCEIAPENDVKITSIILAPLRDINSATPKEKVNELISSNVLREGTQASYLKYFYLEPNDRLEFKNGAIVDFSKCFSIRKNS